MKLWIRIDVAISSDPNVIELARRLNIPFAEAVGLCLLVWARIAEHRPSGSSSGLSIDVIEQWAMFKSGRGKPKGSFGSTFLELFASDGEFSGWHDRQGALIDRAEKEKTRKARGKRADVPRKVAPTERNGTERDGTDKEEQQLIAADAASSGELFPVHASPTGTFKAIAQDDSEPPVVTKVTWLTPYCDIWTEVLGGVLNAKHAASVLGPLHKLHGRQKVQLHLRNFCVAHKYKKNAAYATINRFGETFSVWETSESPETMSRDSDKQAKREAGGRRMVERYGPLQPLRPKLEAKSDV